MPVAVCGFSILREPFRQRPESTPLQQNTWRLGSGYRFVAYSTRFAEQFSVAA
jgi:hypothetical protein